MLNVKRKLIILLIILTGIAIMACTSIPYALAQNTTKATVVGQVNVNGVATNGVSVVCGPGSATTSSSNGVDGVFIISDLPFGTSMPFSATYQGQTYTDTVDPLSTDQQYFELPAVNIDVQASTATPTANVTVTPTPITNATITPTPVLTPTPTPTPTAIAATATSAPSPIPSTASSPGQSPPGNPPAGNPPTDSLPPGDAPAALPGAPPGAPPVTMPENSNPSPTTVIKKSLSENATATPSPTGTGTPNRALLTSPQPTAQPTTTKSPGFTGALALVCLLGAAYLVAKKDR